MNMIGMVGLVPNQPTSTSSSVGVLKPLVELILGCASNIPYILVKRLLETIVEKNIFNL